jgi:hypothetical protein
VPLLEREGFSGSIAITVNGKPFAGFDKSYLRNAVQGPLAEANIDALTI